MNCNSSGIFQDYNIHIKREKGITEGFQVKDWITQTCLQQSNGHFSPLHNFPVMSSLLHVSPMSMKCSVSAVCHCLQSLSLCSPPLFFSSSSLPCSSSLFLLTGTYHLMRSAVGGAEYCDQLGLWQTHQFQLISAQFEDVPRHPFFARLYNHINSKNLFRYSDCDSQNYSSYLLHFAFSSVGQWKTRCPWSYH